MDRLSPDVMRQQLQAWLVMRMPDAGALVVNGLQYPTSAGRSAETSFITINYSHAGRPFQEELVVRRQHTDGEIFLGADLVRPWKAMRAVEACSDIPVPGGIGLELNPQVLGTPFFVTRRQPGRVPPMAPNYNLEGWVKALSPDERGALWTNGLRQIARINALDPRSGFEFLDDPSYGESGLDQYLNWLSAWYRWVLGERHYPLGEAALAHLLKHRPAAAPLQVLWGDPGPHNLLFRDDLTVSAVLDWEAASLGPGEMDLAWWLFFNEMMSEAIEVERLPGLPSRADSIAIYEDEIGRAVQDMDYYSLLAEFRMLIVGIRQDDRRAGGSDRTDVEIFRQRPADRMVARRLGYPEPPKGPAYFAICARLGKAF